MSTPELTVVGSYRRALGAGLDRMHENVLDWEHLPWLHASSFTSIRCEDAGAWGFRAEVGLQPSGEQILLELLLDRDRSQWVSRTLDGPGAGSEIWTVAAATGPRTCTVDVEFHLPGVRTESVAQLGAYYVALYTRLYDEDESMMVGRQEALDRRAAGEAAWVATRCPHRLGPLDDAEVCDGIITCPWHGYRFEVASGRCLDDPRLRLGVLPGERG